MGVWCAPTAAQARYLHVIHLPGWAEIEGTRERAERGRSGWVTEPEESTFGCLPGGCSVTAWRRRLSVSSASSRSGRVATGFGLRLVGGAEVPAIS